MTSEEKINKFMSESVNKKDGINHFVILGDVPQRAKDIVFKKYKIDLSNYKYIIDVTGVKHSFNRHGELSNDRTPIVESDFIFIPFIMSQFDDVELGGTVNNNLKTLLFKKKIANKYYYVAVQEVRTGKKSLALMSLRKRKTQ